MKVLIATATAGGGHLQAAAALEEAWRHFYPRDQIQRVDILTFTPMLYRKAYAEGYVRLAEKAPEVYAHAFRTTDTPAFVRKITAFRRFSSRWIARKFVRYLKAFAPDVVLCPHFMPIEVMGSLAAHGFRGPRPFTVCIVTDFEAHALWMEPCVDLYCVAMQETKARLVARGIDASKIIVTGIPISQRFAKSVPRPPVVRRLHLNPTQPTLLVLGGGMGMGPLVETVRALDKCRTRAQLLVVTGKNVELKATLERLTFKHPVQIFGFVEEMQELMTVADLIVTKPGGLTTSESLALGRPLLIVNPLPGQEMANSDFLLERGAAIKANRLEDLPSRVDAVMKGTALKRLSVAAKRLGKPHAARAICKGVVHRRRRLPAVPLAVMAALAAVPQTQAARALEPRDDLRFLPTLAAQSADGQRWQIPLHTWTFRPELDSRRRRVLLTMLSRTLRLSDAPQERGLFKRRAQMFLVKNIRRSFIIQIGSTTVPMEAATASGHGYAEGSIPISSATVPNTWMRYAISGKEAQPPARQGRSFLAGPDGVIIVSDLDDTVKLTGVRNRRALLANTFLEPYRAIDGMAELYRGWARASPTAAFVYVSASPWQLVDELEEFLERNQFPLGALELKPFRWKDRSFFTLFQNPIAYKTALLVGLLQHFPKRRFVLVGDSGEKDPEIYGAIARRYPQQVTRVFIRRIGASSSPRFHRAFKDVPAGHWTVFTDPVALRGFSL